MAGLGMSRSMPIALDRLLAIALAQLLAVTTHLPLALVVERQAKRIPKGHQGAFHRIGFGLLDGRFMGQAQVGIDAMAGAGALANQGPDGDADPGDVGHPPAGLLITPDAIE